MNAILLKCKECGKVYAVGDLDKRDGHRCKCGTTLDRWGNYFGECETAERPNRPWEKEDSQSDNKKLHEITVRLNVEKSASFEKVMEELEGTGEVKAIPVFSKDTELLIFRTIAPMRKEDRETTAKEYTDKLGVKCEVVDCRTELVAAING